jgi:tetratricopeptide (TPR) repeat protein
MTFALLLLALIPSSQAEVPLPSYRDDLTLAAWHAINSQIENACDLPAGAISLVCSDPMLNKAIDEANNFQNSLFVDARLEYLIGLAHRYAGRTQLATGHFKQAILLDNTRQDAWYDLGEIYLAQGKYDEAQHAFQQVSDLVPTGRHSWIGPWRLGEVAAHRGDVEDFESHMREALRRGFSFNNVKGLTNWKNFYANPVLHDSIEKLITVYGNPAVLETLERP